jgi:diadenosine tetraphosphate (Ap4A) HIT family hydrolase
MEYPLTIHHFIFRKELSHMHCIFCNDILEQHILVETNHFKVVFDIDPIQHGHVLIISKEHLMDLRELSTKQHMELVQLEKAIITIFDEYFSIPGATVIQNNGTIMDEGTHFHVHVVPRYEDDHFWDNQSVKEHWLSLDILKAQLASLKIHKERS